MPRVTVTAPPKRLGGLIHESSCGGRHVYYNPSSTLYHHEYLTDADVAEYQRREAYDRLRQERLTSEAQEQECEGKKQRAELVCLVSKTYPERDAEKWVEVFWSHEHTWAPRPGIERTVCHWLDSPVVDRLMVSCSRTRGLTLDETRVALEAIGLGLDATIDDIQRVTGKFWLGYLEKNRIGNGGGPYYCDRDLESQCPA